MTGLIPVPRYLSHSVFIAVLTCGHQRQYAGVSLHERTAYCITCEVARVITCFISMHPPEAA